MNAEKVLVVLNCFSRPGHIKMLAKAWKEQSADTHVVLIDNRPRVNVFGPEVQVVGEVYPVDSPDIDDVWRIMTNLGCVSHFYPPLAMQSFKYCIFADDDLLPGKRAVEHLVQMAADLEDRFATIGQIGRTINASLEPNNRYNARNTPKRSSGKPCKVDMTCRAHMIKTADIIHAFTIRQNILDYNSGPKYEKIRSMCNIHDDMLLSFGIQTATGDSSYLTPIMADPEFDLIRKDMDDQAALWRRPGHYADRNAMVDLCILAGWKPI